MFIVAAKSDFGERRIDSETVFPLAWCFINPCTVALTDPKV